MHGVITASNIVEGVRATMRAGGCSASRASFIAACFGAKVKHFGSHFTRIYEGRLAA